MYEHLWAEVQSKANTTSVSLDGSVQQEVSIHGLYMMMGWALERH